MERLGYRSRVWEISLQQAACASGAIVARELAFPASGVLRSIAPPAAEAYPSEAVRLVANSIEITRKAKDFLVIMSITLTVFSAPASPSALGLRTGALAIAL